MFLSRNSWHALAIVVGTTVGVGIFGVPYVLAQSGALIGLLHIAGIGMLLIMLNLLYAEVVLRTEDRQQLVGIVRTYVGSGWGRFVTLLTVVNFCAALLAYSIAGGEFVSLFARSIAGIDLPTALWGTLFTIAGALIVYSGARSMAESELGMTIALLAVLVLLCLIAFMNGSWGNLPVANWSAFAAPYGVVLFALSSVSMVPLLEELLEREKESMSRVIVWGGAISAAATALFGIAVLSVSGTASSPEALAGMAQAIGPAGVIIATIFGILAIITSYVVIGENATQIFHYDYHIPRPLAWLLACGAPLALYLFGTKNFIAVLDISGSLFGGIIGIIIAGLYLRARTIPPVHSYHYKVRGGPIWAWLAIAVFALGILYQISTW